MQKRFEDRVEISFYIERAEYEALQKVIPAEMTLSGLMRSLVRGYAVGAGAPATNGSEGMVGGEIPVAGTIERPRPVRKPFRKQESSSTGGDGKACVHGKQRGENCWQCQGLAKV